MKKKTGVRKDVVPVDYVEPNLILLRDLRPGGDLHAVLPKAVIEAAVEQYKQKRDEFKLLVGRLKIAYWTGYRAGQQDERDQRETCDKCGVVFTPGFLHTCI